MIKGIRTLASAVALGFVALPLAAQAPRQTAVLSGGCFWGIQNLFEHVRGVEKVVAGYAGGTAETANDQAVGSETTNHAESVEITFDPRLVSYETLLDVFFTVAHDPTQLNRQGPDVGKSYRSAIFYRTEEQERAARDVIARLERSRRFSRPIVTQVVPFSGFYRAEEFHQDFAVHHPDYPYIVINDLPKVADLRARFPALYRDAAVRTSSR